MVAQTNTTIFKKHPAKFTAVALIGLMLGVLEAANYFFPTYQINGLSMMPTVNPSERYPATRLFDTPKRSEVFMISPEDLVQSDVEHPDGPYMKRILGLPGDRLTIRKQDGILTHVNGEAVKYSPSNVHAGYSLKSKYKESEGSMFANYAHNAMVDGKSYITFNPDPKAFAGGDPSLARYTQVIFHYPWLNTQKESLGSVTFTVPNKHYFVLSDNTTSGTDSRHFGPVHESALLHKVLL